MKVIGLVCSPRKSGNTEILVREALGAVRKAGGETELIRVADKKISGCQGCGSCHSTGVCRIKDDMQGIYEALDSADGLIFGSPAYFCSVSSQAKAVLDRTYCMLLTKRLRNKIAAAVIATHRIGGSQALTYLDFFFSNQRMLIAGGVIGFGLNKGDVRKGVGAWRNSALEEARSVGKSVARMIQQQSAE